MSELTPLIHILEPIIRNTGDVGSNVLMELQAHIAHLTAQAADTRELEILQVIARSDDPEKAVNELYADRNARKRRAALNPTDTQSRGEE